MYDADMEKRITRNVSELQPPEKALYESVLGEQLRENQQVIIQVMTVGEPQVDHFAATLPRTDLPAWCDVYDGLTDEDVAEVEAIALDRSDLSRRPA
ncbi:hypothetical protein Pan189_27860 [Stratiformator vulcanicus]|uniref:Uncharacterized protein n=2 Tax=Stratiformator vulcanicus TaxID=2527980 RepID=A0A517R3I7_9PLAN|nr:hypothetical protein Pan189_27860 [Stratiformator vulcanicus]